MLLPRALHRCWGSGALAPAPSARVQTTSGPSLLSWPSGREEKGSGQRWVGGRGWAAQGPQQEPADLSLGLPLACSSGTRVSRSGTMRPSRPGPAWTLPSMCVPGSIRTVGDGLTQELWQSVLWNRVGTPLFAVLQSHDQDIGEILRLLAFLGLRKMHTRPATLGPRGGVFRPGDKA